MNVLLTNKCNRKCPYCFAQERVSFPEGSENGEVAKTSPDEISRHDFERVVAFARQSHVRRLGILGGEPSLHSEFVDLISHAHECGLQVNIFSNGLWRDDQIEAVASLGLDEGAGFKIIVNTNHPDDTPEWQQKAQEKLFSRLGPFCSLSYNIYRVDFDPSFLVDIIDRYACLRNIRLGIAVPLAEHRSQFVAIEDYRDLSPTIMRLAQLCDEQNISLGFDCGFLLCMFSAEDLGNLQLAGARFKASCGPAIDIGTDLSVWACFPLSTFAKGAHLDDFKNHHELIHHFKNQFERLYRAGAMEMCTDCKHRIRKQCSGGCAAHVYRSVNQ